jgi:hypothetical protein
VLDEMATYVDESMVIRRSKNIAKFTLLEVDDID